MWSLWSLQNVQGTGVVYGDEIGISSSVVLEPEVQSSDAERDKKVKEEAERKAR